MVRTGVGVCNVFCPPTSRSFGPSVPVGPWQTAHLAAYTGAPCLAVPSPGGNPSPVGKTSIFQARISSSVAGRPIPSYSLAFSPDQDAELQLKTIADAPM